MDNHIFQNPFREKTGNLNVKNKVRFINKHLGHVDELEMRARNVTYCVQLLAINYGVSERQLERYFQHELRERPKTWMMRLRIRDGSVQIAKGMKLKEVATNVGYNNSNHFTRAFKKVMGVTPKEFFRQSRKHVDIKRGPDLLVSPNGHFVA